jgi:DNA-binding transcriptional LysR family regulator
MVVRPDKNPGIDRVSTSWSALSGETLISLTPNYPHQQLIDKQLARTGVTWTRGRIVNLLDTQIGLVEADQGIAIIPSFGLLACRYRMVSMSELVDPVVTLGFHEVSNSGTKLSPEAAEFSSFLKRYIARWAGDTGVL